MCVCTRVDEVDLEVWGGNGGLDVGKVPRVDVVGAKVCEIGDGVVEGG